MLTPADLPGRDGSVPHEFDRYRLQEWLGGGGMGSVYLALDLKLEIKVELTAGARRPRRHFER